MQLVYSNKLISLMSENTGLKRHLIKEKYQQYLSVLRNN